MRGILRRFDWVWSIFLGMFLFTVTGCINMSTLQTAEILTPGEGRAIIGGGYYTSPSVNESIKEEAKKDESGTAAELEDIKVPYAEFGYRYGVNEDLEIGGKLTLIGTIGVDGKYKLLDRGDFDVATGAGIGYVSIESSSGSGETEIKSESTMIDFTVPLYLSYRLAPAFAMYSAPKYIYRNIASKVTDAGVSESKNAGVSLVGATLGSMIGQSWGLALEGTYMKDVASDFNMMQIAFALFF